MKMNLHNTPSSMRLKNKINRFIILISSILTLLIVIAYFIHVQGDQEFPDFYIQENKWYEDSIMLYYLPFLVPSLIGFWAFHKKLEKVSISILYIAYFLIAIVSYSSVIWSKNPLETGLLFVAVEWPFSIFIGLYMLIVNLGR